MVGDLQRSGSCVCVCVCILSSFSKSCLRIGPLTLADSHIFQIWRKLFNIGPASAKLGLNFPRFGQSLPELGQGLVKCCEALPDLVGPGSAVWADIRHALGASATDRPSSIRTPYGYLSSSVAASPRRGWCVRGGSSLCRNVHIEGGCTWPPRVPMDPDFAPAWALEARACREERGRDSALFSLMERVRGGRSGPRESGPLEHAPRAREERGVSRSFFSTHRRLERPCSGEIGVHRHARWPRAPPSPLSYDPGHAQSRIMEPGGVGVARHAPPTRIHTDGQIFVSENQAPPRSRQGTLGSRGHNQLFPGFLGEACVAPHGIPASRPDMHAKPL